jgi:hypothetical protein
MKNVIITIYKIFKHIFFINAKINCGSICIYIGLGMLQAECGTDGGEAF